MAKLLDVFKSLTSKDKNKWMSITDEDKEEFFFIINRFMSKKYHTKSQLLNEKLINKVSAMDTWFIFMQSQQYPSWFWSKNETKKDLPEINDKEINSLSKYLNINIEDTKNLIRFYPDLVKDELKYLIEVEKTIK